MFDKKLLVLDNETVFLKVKNYGIRCLNVHSPNVVETLSMFVIELSFDLDAVITSIMLMINVRHCWDVLTVCACVKKDLLVC